MSKWMLRQSTADYKDIARRIGISPVLARILAVRGYRTAEDICKFLEGTMQNFADPFLFMDMDKAVDATINAIKTGKNIVIYGDYDADGVMSTVILINTLRSLGAEPSYYIPVREGEGYGMNKAAVTHLAEQGVNFIITCDNGISSYEEIEFAASLGIDVIVLDHHAVTIDDAGNQLLPPALAVVDAKRQDCPYPYKEYCGAGICYRFSQALYERLGKDWQKIGEYCLPFAAIATVCDIVDLTDENRYLVRQGLAALNEYTQLGIKALIEANSLTESKINTYHVGYSIGPCINASGRLDVADTAVELFLTEDKNSAYIIAETLVEMNHERRDLTEHGTELAFELIEKSNYTDDKIIVLNDPDFAQSVAGIIAGKIKEHFHRPAIVIAGTGDVLRGSCRSVEAYNIYEGLCGCQDYLKAFGGHPMAAGLSIDADKVDAFRAFINEACSLTIEELQTPYRIDCPLEPIQADISLAHELTLMEPFGKANPEPLFACKGLKLNKIVLMGKEDKVMRLHFTDMRGNKCVAVSFNGKEQLMEYITSHFSENCWSSLLAGRCREKIILDIIYTVNLNIYNGRESVQLRTVDIRPGNII